MNKPNLMDSKKGNSNTLLKEIGEAIIDMIAGTIASKAGWSIILIIALGSVFTFSPIVGEINKPTAFYVIGVICWIWALYLLISRAIEIRKENKE